MAQEFWTGLLVGAIIGIVLYEILNQNSSSSGQVLTEKQKNCKYCRYLRLIDNSASNNNTDEEKIELYCPICGRKIRVLKYEEKKE